jgi:hypothetical protein
MSVPEGVLNPEKLWSRVEVVGARPSPSRPASNTSFSDGEHALSSWMSTNAFVCWHAHAEPWTLEEELISRYDLPLNLDQNKHNAFHPELSTARKAAKQRAAELPILER